MYALTIIAALAVSIAVLIHLARTDPKRRRVFGLPVYHGKRRGWQSLVVLFMPGVFLLTTGDAAGFTIWLGALTVIGWGVAALRPEQDTALRNKVSGITKWTGEGMTGGWRSLRDGICSGGDFYRTLRDAPERITALEDRVAELEAELADLRYRPRLGADVRHPDEDESKSACIAR